MAERPDYPCPATGLPYCPDYCNVACLRLGDGVEPHRDGWCCHTGERCDNDLCLSAACLYDIDEAVWPEVEVDELSAANSPAPFLAGEQ